MPKTRATPKVRARDRATPTSAGSTSKRCSRRKTNKKQDALAVGAMAVESGVGGGATSDMPGEYRVSVDASGVDVDVSSIACMAHRGRHAHAKYGSGWVSSSRRGSPTSSERRGFAPPALAFGSDSAPASATQPPMLACVCDDLGSDVPISVKEKKCGGANSLNWVNF